VPNYQIIRASGTSSTSTINIFYTADPIRTDLHQATGVKTSRNLQLLGSVSEPINPEAWEWLPRGRRQPHCRSSIPGGRPSRRHFVTPLPGATKQARFGDTAVLRRGAWVVTPKAGAGRRDVNNLCLAKSGRG
jgi:hypothetical protein